MAGSGFSTLPSARYLAVAVLARVGLSVLVASTVAVVAFVRVALSRHHRYASQPRCPSASRAARSRALSRPVHAVAADAHPKTHSCQKRVSSRVLINVLHAKTCSKSRRRISLSLFSHAHRGTSFSGLTIISPSHFAPSVSLIFCSTSALSQQITTSLTVFLQNAKVLGSHL